MYLSIFRHSWKLQFIIIISSGALLFSSQHDFVHARRHAVCRPVLAGFRSFSTVRVHVCLGRPWGCFDQSAGGPQIAARRWSISGSDLAMWQFMYVMAISTIYIETGVTHHHLLLTGLKVACVTVSRWKHHRHQQFSGDAERQEMKRQHGRLSSTQQLSFSWDALL